MAIKTTVYISDEREQAINERHREKPNLSGALGMFIDRYCAIVRAHTPDLTTAEWCCLFDVYCSHMFADDILAEARMLPTCVHDSIEDGTLAKWDLEGDAFLAKLQALAPVERVAVLDMVQRFWARDWQGMDNYGQIIGRLLGKTGQGLPVKP